MTYRRFKAQSIFAGLALVSGIFLSNPAAQGQTITVGLGTQRSVKANFYGVNGQERNNTPWDQTGISGCTANSGFSNALQGLNLGTLRFPGGDQGSYWDWKTGDYVTNFPLQPGSGLGVNDICPSNLGEFQAELNSASQSSGTQTTGDFVLNALDDPTMKTTDPNCHPSGGQCTFNPQSPNESYQLSLLSKLVQDGINVTYLELGNEFYGGGSGSAKGLVYPNGTNYINAMETWSKDIKNQKSSFRTAVTLTECKALGTCTDASDSREYEWNGLVMDGMDNNIDAVVLHDYQASSLTTPVDGSNVETMLVQPFLNWDTLTSSLFPNLVTNTGYNPYIWFTEYNLQDPNAPNVHADGTWAQGLFVATKSLLYATNSRVQLALHHETQACNRFGDIFSCSTAFNNMSGLNITSKTNGYTAMGLTTRAVDAAALGQTNAQPLTFPDGPTFDGTHPKLIGELFGSTTSGQIIILNLSASSQTVKLSGIVSGGTYREIYGEAGSYVDGSDTSNGYEGWDDKTGNSANLTLDTGTLTPSSFTLQPLSITRITVTN